MKQPFVAPLGKKVAKIRKMRGIGTEVLAKELNVSVADVMQIEQSETIEEEVLQKIADALGVTVASIHSFNDDAVTINIQHMHQQASVYHYNINPIEKIIELYEDLLRLEREKIVLLEKSAGKK